MVNPELIITGILVLCCCFCCCISIIGIYFIEESDDDDDKGSCIRPTNDVYNFNGITENLKIDEFNVSGVTCSDRYEGTVTTSVCSSSGTPYRVSGCRSIDVEREILPCVRPSVEGYNFTNEMGSLSVSDFNVSGITCDTGYEGTVTTSVCNTEGTPYNVSGCSPIVLDVEREILPCVRPSVEGYNFTNEMGSLSVSDFNVSGITCDTGYEGTVTTSVCNTEGTPYNVSGCSPIVLETGCNSTFTEDELGDKYRLIDGVDITNFHLLSLLEYSNEDINCSGIGASGVSCSGTVNTSGSINCSGNSSGIGTISCNSSGVFILDGCSGMEISASSAIVQSGDDVNQSIPDPASPDPASPVPEIPDSVKCPRSVIATDTNYVLTQPAQLNYNVGQTVKANCVSGYRIANSNDVNGMWEGICLSTGEFSGEKPVCTSLT